MRNIEPPKRLLFGPGPSQVEQRVYDAMAQPVVGYLDPYLFEVIDHVRRDLRTVFGTKNAFTLPISGTGSAGMETAISNFVEKGSKFAVFVNGFFGERIAEMGRRHGANLVRLDKPWGEAFTEAEAKAFLEREKPAAVAFVHAETSTGVLQNPMAITKTARELGALVIADCVTSLGAVPVNVDASGIDVAFSCTQKGLSSVPGMSPFTASDKAIAQMDARKDPNLVWYLDLKLLREYYENKKYHHTAPVTNIYSLREALAAIMDEGATQRFARHAKAHESFVKRVEAIGLQMLVAPGSRLPNLNTVRVPEGVNDAAVRTKMLQEYGIEIAGGLGALAGKIFRVGVMGPLADEKQLDVFFDAFAKCLKQ
jgi:alanine-glyoxylate transaminase/serine-glyoxylate transaminase/serine-pyruvate transaminase